MNWFDRLYGWPKSLTFFKDIRNPSGSRSQQLLKEEICSYITVKCLVCLFYCFWKIWDTSNSYRRSDCAKMIILFSFENFWTFVGKVTNCPWSKIGKNTAMCQVWSKTHVYFYIKSLNLDIIRIWQNYPDFIWASIPFVLQNPPLGVYEPNNPF